MFVSKKKKLIRDRKAGLVFRWRGGRRTNRGGGTLAFLLTSAFFAGGFLFFNVYAKPNTVPSRYRATINHLVGSDDSLNYWIERNSPLITQSSELADIESVDRVDELLVTKINATQHRGAGYRELEFKAVETTGDEMFSVIDDTLPSLKQHTDALDLVQETSEPVEGNLQWELDIVASEDLNNRLPDALNVDQWILQNWGGGSVRFNLAVDPSGKVLTADLVEWSENETIKEMERWLYTLKFKPLNDAPTHAEKETGAGIVIGIVELRSVAKFIPAENENIEKEVGP